MKQHLAGHYLARNKVNDNTFKCDYCGETFDDIPQLYKYYRRAHKRRDEIIRIAEDAGLLAAGVPSFGMATSAIIKDSVDMHLLEAGHYESDTPQAAQIFGRGKMN